MSNAAQSFNRLLSILEDLREQCPWDRAQTFDSLRPNTIEETYELSESLLAKDMSGMKEELGDLLLHIAFYAKMASEESAFNIADVCDAVSDKLVRRHPHIYGDTNADSEKAVRQNWEQIKQQEKTDKGTFDGIPASLSSLIKASRLQEKASGVGFDWNHNGQVWDKVKEEIQEFQQEVEKAKSQDNGDALNEEFGDLLFSLVNYARFIGIDPDNALEKTNQKFTRRFNRMEQQVRDAGRAMKDMKLSELEGLWQAAKADS
jgi:XTP/dITP diphosphohydrolase